MICYKFETYKLGTVWCFTFYDLNFDKKFYFDLEDEINSKLEDFNNKYSRFEKTSLVGVLNQQKKLNKPTLDLIKMLNFSQKIFEATNHNFDITICQDLENKGYKNSFDKIITNSGLKAIKNNTGLKNPKLLTKSDFSRVGRDTLEGKDTALEKKSKSTFDFKNFVKAKNSKCNFYIDPKSKQVFLNPEKKIDLGGLGKGYLVDKIVRFLKRKKVCNFSINAGGDIFNTHSRNFYLQSPTEKDKFLGKIKIHNQAIAASNPLYRNWKKNGKRMDHFIQKLDFQNQIAGIYTQAKSCLIADSIATALFVSSPTDQLNLYKNSDFKFEFMMVFKDKSFFKTKGYLGKIFC